MFYSRILRRTFKLLKAIASSMRKLIICLQYPTCSIGKGTYVSSGVEIRATDGGSITMGRNCQIQAGAVLVVKRGTLVIGDNSFIGWGTIICSNEQVYIGEDCLIAEHVTIRDQNHGTNIELGTFRSQQQVTSPIKIENNVWIGAKATILSGVSIGRNSVVAANAVVTKDVVESSVVGGVPARLLRNIDVGTKKNVT